MQFCNVAAHGLYLRKTFRFILILSCVTKFSWLSLVNLCNKWRIFQRATSDFLQGANFCYKQLLKRVTTDFLQQATSATSNKHILERVTSDFTTSSEQWVKSSASNFSPIETWGDIFLSRSGPNVFKNLKIKNNLRTRHME